MTDFLLLHEPMAAIFKMAAKRLTSDQESIRTFLKILRVAVQKVKNNENRTRRSEDIGEIVNFGGHLEKWPLTQNAQGCHFGTRWIWIQE